VLLGCSIDEAANVIEDLGSFPRAVVGRSCAEKVTFHVPVATFRAREEVYGQQIEPFLARYGDDLPDAVVAVVKGLRSRLAAVVEGLHKGPETLAHADLHLDNIIFDPPAMNAR
jgi:aminoglycoside phosphotransferase (APT) family kinase protein